MSFFVSGMEVYRLFEDLHLRNFSISRSPRAINPVPFLSFGKAEPESVCIDLLQASVDTHNWVGVSWRDLALRRQNTFIDKKIRTHVPKQLGYMVRFPETGDETFGMVGEFRLGGNFCSWERSTIKGFPLGVINGVKLLLKDSFVEIVEYKKEDIICPTEKLIEKALSACRY